FSSRRRHTRCYRDWSSDVCSSDLEAQLFPYIRVNAISAGPLNTLAARGVSGFTSFREHMGIAAPLRRNIEQSEVGDAALFLSSPLARAITGEILFVDAGYNIMGA